MKKALITNILGKDLSRLSKKRILTETEIYENDTHEFICTPDLSTNCNDIRDVFVGCPHPDMSLLVVEDGFSSEQVWQQIEKLEEKTGTRTDEFIVVLPLSCKAKEYPFKSYSLEQVVKNLMPPNKR